MNELCQISQNKTLIIIVQRLSAIELCDKVYTLQDGKVVNIL